MLSHPTLVLNVWCAQVELHERRGDTIPEGWGCDPQGKLTTDPKRVLDGGGLVPIGGSEATGQKPADTTVGIQLRELEILGPLLQSEFTVARISFCFPASLNQTSAVLITCTTELVINWNNMTETKRNKLIYTAGGYMASF